LDKDNIKKLTENSRENYRRVEMFAFLEVFLKHLHSAGNWRGLWIYCAPTQTVQTLFR